jgi:hypothetical protein
MLTSFTQITAGTLQQLDGRISYNTARRRLIGLRDSLGRPTVFLRDLATLWDVPQDDLITALSPKKKA